MLLTELSRRLLEQLDERKERKMLRKQDPEVKKRRQVLRGMKKRGEDQPWEKEGASYTAGSFDVPEDLPPESGASMTSRCKGKKKKSVHEGASSAKRPSPSPTVNYYVRVL